MAQNQYTSAIPVVLSDTINIPNPGIITSGTNTGGALVLTDAGQDFTNAATNPQGYNIRGGDAVISAAGVICEVGSVDSATQITLLAPGIAAGTYDIYKGNYTINAGISPGFSLYVGTLGNVDVLTVNDEEVSFVGVLGGTTIDLQVQRVLTTTTATDIIALR